MSANAECDGHPAEYRWRPLFNAAKFGLMPTTRMPCSNAAKRQNPLKLTGLPQTNEPISAASEPKFTILKGHAGRHFCLTSFFPIVETCLSCEDIAQQSCAMVRRWRIFDDFLCPVFSASRMQQVSDLPPKFALRPHICGSMVYIQSATAEISRGKKRRKIEEKKPQGKNITACPIP